MERALYAEGVTESTAFPMPVHLYVAYLQQGEACRTSWKRAVSQEVSLSI